MRLEKPDPYEIDITRPITHKDLPSWKYFADASNWSLISIVSPYLAYLVEQIEKILTDMVSPEEHERLLEEAKVNKVPVDNYDANGNYTRSAETNIDKAVIGCWVCGNCGARKHGDCKCHETFKVLRETYTPTPADDGFLRELDGLIEKFEDTTIDTYAFFTNNEVSAEQHGFAMDKKIAARTALRDFVLAKVKQGGDHSGAVTDMMPAVEPVSKPDWWRIIYKDGSSASGPMKPTPTDGCEIFPLYRHPSPVAGAAVGSRPPRLEEAYAEALVDMTWCILSDMFKNSMESNGDSRDIVNTIIDCAQEFEIRFQRQVANGEIDPTDYLLEIEKESSLVYKSLINNEFIKKG